MKRKCLAVGIILLFIGTAIIPSSGQQIEKISLPTSRGNTLYVGGSGPGNYTKIQDAVDNASDGDTVFVYEGTYHESIAIEKSIALMGEDKNLTIITAQVWPLSPDAISIEANEVTISGFTIQHEALYFGSGIILQSSYEVTIVNNIIIGGSNGVWCSQSYNVRISENNISDNHIGIGFESCYYCHANNNLINNNNFSGIHIDHIFKCYVENNSIMFNNEAVDIVYSRDCYVENNSIIFNNWSGVDIQYSYNCDVKNNSIMYSKYGVLFIYSNFCEVASNRISSNQRQLYLGETSSSTIQHNVFENSVEGIELSLCEDTLVMENSIYNHTVYGLLAFYSFYTTVTRNNFRNNKPHLYFWDSQIFWNENYWGRPMILPKLIIGMRSTNVFNHFVYFPVVNFDWHPAKEPYDIGGI